MHLTLTPEEHRRLWDHLLRPHGGEEVAFILARDDGGVLTPIHTILVPRNAYTYNSRVGIELTDAFRAGIIKEAHDRDAMIIEFHSHPFPVPAAFSPIDIAGLREFVPHVRWRLKGKPYAAIVVAPESFDALFWSDRKPEPLAINIGNTVMLPTRRTEWSDRAL